MEHKEDIAKLKKHVGNVIDTGYSMKDMAHLGGVSSFLTHLEEKDRGAAHKIRKEVRHFFDYVFKYEMTCNAIYCAMAKEAFKDVEWCYESIMDPHEKREVKEIVDLAKCELDKLMGKSAEPYGVGSYPMGQSGSESMVSIGSSVSTPTISSHTMGTEGQKTYFGGN